MSSFEERLAEIDRQLTEANQDGQTSDAVRVRVRARILLPHLALYRLEGRRIPRWLAKVIPRNAWDEAKPYGECFVEE